MPTSNPRFTLTLPEELLELIDDFRFENRYNTRTEAVLELLRLGLDQVAQKPQAPDSK